MDAVAKCGDDQRYGDEEIEVRAQLDPAHLRRQPQNRDHRDCIGKHEQKTQPRNARDFRDLDHHHIRMKRHAERVPAKAQQRKPAHPFQRHPRRRDDDTEAEIAHRRQQHRALMRRKRVRLFHPHLPPRKPADKHRPQRGHERNPRAQPEWQKAECRGLEKRRKFPQPPKDRRVSHNARRVA